MAMTITLSFSLFGITTRDPGIQRIQPFLMLYETSNIRITQFLLGEGWVPLRKINRSDKIIT